MKGVSSEAGARPKWEGDRGTWPVWCSSQIKSMPESSERMSRYSTSRWANHWGSQATTTRNRRTESSHDGPLSWSGRTERVGAIEAQPSTSAASANDTRLQIPRPLVSSSDLMHLQGFYVPGHPPHSQPLFHRHSSSLEHLLLDKSERKSLSYSIPQPIAQFTGCLLCLRIYTILLRPCH